MKNILKKPLVSEKSFSKVAMSKFTFIVNNSASKYEIKAMVEDLFKVTVTAVNTINIIGKVKKGKKGMGKRSDIRKAIVTLKKGDKIDLFEIEKEDKEKSKAESPKSKTKEVKATKEDKDTTVKVREKSKK